MNIFIDRVQYSHRNVVKFSGIVYFNGRNGCQNCTVVGTYHKTMSYPQIDCNRRTNESFRDRIDSKHHHKYSCLELLPIDMISDFVIADPLHLLELGIMRRLLRIWIAGEIVKDLKLPKNDVKALENLLLECNESRPKEIHRSIRSLGSMKYWKGSEYRTVLLYVGVVVLKGILQRDVYNHFLYLFCAVTICSSDVYKQLVPLAKTLFDEYVTTYIDLYGQHTVSSNVHNLCHVTENVERFGNLNSISTYPFENAARVLKLKLKRCDKSIEQASKRITEMNLNEKAKKPAAPLIELKYPFTSLQCSHILMYKFISIKNVVFSSRRFGDRWLLTKNDEIIEFKCAMNLKNEIVICGSPLKIKTDFFEKPFKSSFLHIYLCEKESGSDRPYKLNEIKCKMFCLCSNDKFVFVPLIHTLDIFK